MSMYMCSLLAILRVAPVDQYCSGEYISVRSRDETDVITEYQYGGFVRSKMHGKMFTLGV